MGIDVYLEWEGQTDEEKQKQITGFSIQSGHVGYLREAYHGGPYATKVLAPECWEQDEPSVQIPAETLRARLPQVIGTAERRSLAVYNEELPEHARKAFEDFVELAEQKERETGKPCTVTASY